MSESRLQVSTQHEVLPNGKSWFAVFASWSLSGGRAGTSCAAKPILVFAPTGHAVVAGTTNLAGDDLGVTINAKCLMTEDVLNSEEIQGNILGGFNKPNQAFIALRITDVGLCKRWLRTFADHLTSVAEVARHKALRLKMRERLGAV